jgi:hypothetical protein
MEQYPTHGRLVLKTVSRIAALAVAAALVVAPASALAAKGGQGKAQGKAKSCAKTLTRGYQVTGTLVSWTEDTVTLTVTSANRHARNSGELAGETYTVSTADVLKLGNDGAAVPSVGDRVKVKGRIALTKKRCADEAASLEDRYEAPDVTRVTISDRDPETTVPETT